MLTRNSTPLLAVGLLIGVVLACSNPLARYTKQYHCQIPGEPEPRSAEEYAKRGGEHLQRNFETGHGDGELDCALGACDEAIRLAPRKASGYVCRGSVYQSKEQYELALADYQEAIRLDPSDIRVYLNRARLYTKKGEPERALQDYSTAISLAPNDGSFVSANVYGSRADFYKGQKDFDHALDDYNEAIKRYPDFGWFYKDRGDVYFAKGDYQRAVDDYREAIRRGDEKDKNYFKSDLAELYRKLNHPELAERIMSTDEPPALPLNVDHGSPSPTNPRPKAPISGGVLNGKAFNLPKPPYPAIAKAAHASGTVIVEITVDENGNVIDAHAISGHPLLQAAAVSPARAAKFSPTKLSGQAVKVIGLLQYNFAE